MWYTLGYANTFICAPAHRGRAGYSRDRSPVPVRFYCAPLPDTASQCRGAGDPHDCPPPPLHRSNHPQHHSCLPPARSRRAPAQLVATAHHRNHLRRWHLRVPPGPVASESTDVRQAYQPVDAGAGCRGQFRPGSDAVAGQRRNHSAGPAPVGSGLEACQALDYQPRSRLSPKKNDATG